MIKNKELTPDVVKAIARGYVCTLTDSVVAMDMVDEFLDESAVDEETLCERIVSGINASDYVFVNESDIRLEAAWYVEDYFNLLSAKWAMHHNEIEDFYTYGRGINTYSPYVYNMEPRAGLSQRRLPYYVFFLPAMRGYRHHICARFQSIDEAVRYVSSELWIGWPNNHIYNGFDEMKAKFEIYEESEHPDWDVVEYFAPTSLYDDVNDTLLFTSAYMDISPR